MSSGSIFTKHLSWTIWRISHYEASFITITLYPDGVKNEYNFDYNKDLKRFAHLLKERDHLKDVKLSISKIDVL